MQRKDLALRVLSTAAIMSIVTSIAAPAFADIYYIGNGSIDVETITSTDGKQQYVKVTQGNKTYTDTSDEIVIKDGTDEDHTTLREDTRIKEKRAEVAIPDKERPATQELEAAGSADAAGESQPDPDAAFTLSEEEEDSAQTQEGEDTTKKEEDPPKEPSTENPTENPKKDVVYEYDPVDPEPEQQATKPTLSTSEEPEATAPEATQANAPAAAPTTPTAPAADPPAEGSVKNPTTNVIKVINNWVDGAAKELKIRLSNVNIKVSNREYEAAMDISGGGKTKIELDGQNRLDNSQAQANAGLRKQGEGTLIITDETDDNGNKITAPKSGTSGSLTAKGATSNGSAGIGGKIGESTKNITIEGYATVDATGGSQGAGIGGGGGTAGHVSGDAENIIIRGHSKVTATAGDGAAIGGGSANGSGNDYVGGSAKGIVIRDYATVVAKNNGYGAAIGAAGGSGNHTEAVVTIGTPGATAAKENVHVTATGSNGSAIGNGRVKTEVTIQGNATVHTASSKSPIAIGSYYGNVEVNIKDNASIDTATGAGASGIGGGDFFVHPEKSVVVTINGGENGKIEIGKNSAITGKFGAISATEVNISNNVLLKMKQWASTNGQYISVNGAEAAVGTRSNPTAGGLVNTIGNNTQLWYTDFNGVLQKIVHSKNLCTKHETNHKDANCTENGWVKYECTFEKNNNAVDPEHKDQWTENTDIDPNAHNYVKTTVPPTCGAQGYDEYTCTHDSSHTYKDNYTPATGLHTYGEWTVKTPATCEGEGEEHRTCSMCHKEETRKTAALGHQWKEVSRTGNCGVAGEIHYVCEHDSSHTKTEPVAPTGNHQFNAWHQTKAPTCMEDGEEQHECEVCGKPETRKVDKLDHVEELRGAKEPTCTEPGYTGDKWCTRGDHLLEKGSVIPATGHHWKDNGDGTYTCPDCGATEGQPFNTNSALELRVVDAEGMDQPFTVSQNGTLRTYTGAYDTATLTGDLNTLRYLQEHGAQTIQFVTNSQTSSFAINDLLAQGSGSEVFYLTHRGAEEPTLLLVEADHSELVKD